jgi:hypothetical protein
MRSHTPSQTLQESNHTSEVIYLIYPGLSGEDLHFSMIQSKNVTTFVSNFLYVYDKLDLCEALMMTLLNITLGCFKLHHTT